MSTTELSLITFAVGALMLAQLKDHYQLTVLMAEQNFTQAIYSIGCRCAPRLYLRPCNDHFIDPL